MSDSITTTLHEYVIMALGVPATPELMDGLNGLYGSCGNFTVVDTVMNNYMNSRIATFPDDVYGLVGEVIENGLGITLNNSQAVDITQWLVGNGMDSWSKIFSFCGGLDNEYGVTLENRAIAAASFSSLMDTTGEITAYGTAAGRATVAAWLAEVNYNPLTLASAQAGIGTAIHNMLNPDHGAAQDGYLSGAQVFIDANHNGVLDHGEFATISDTAGNFILPAGVNGQIVATGGTDIATDLVFQGSFTAPVGSTVVNPLTTLMASLMNQGHTQAEAQNLVRTSLGLPEVDLTSFDPIAELSGLHGTEARQVLAAAVQVNNLVTLGASALDGASNILDLNAAFGQVVAALAQRVNTATGQLDLSGSTLIRGVFSDAADSSHVSLSSSRISDTARLVADHNDTIIEVMGLSANASADSLLSWIMQIATISQGSASGDLGETLVAGGTLTSVVADYTGNVFRALVNLAPIGDVNNDGATDTPIDLPIAPPVTPTPDPTPAPPPADATAPNAPTGLDLAAADDSGSSNGDNLTQNTTNLTISGAAEADSTVKLYDTDGTTLLGTGTATGGVFSIDVNLAAGAHILTAKATDAASNTGVASAGLTITVDTTAPATTAAASASGTTDSATALAATVNENGTGYYLVQAAAAAAPDAATVIAANHSFAMTANVQATANISGLVASTAYKVYFVAKDTAGNIQAAVGSVAVTTNAAADTTPNAFTFVDQNNVALSTLTESAAITMAGINAAASISVVGGEYQINGGAWTAVAGTVNNNDTVKVRHTSSGSNSTAINTTLTIGGVSDIFTTTTAADITPPAAPAGLLLDNGAASTTDPDLTVSLDGLTTPPDADLAGWFVSESSSAPAAGDAGWVGIKPTTYTLSAGAGLKTVYVYVKDASGNVQATPAQDDITLN
ncbi:MAG: Ig-like domain-containing protein [Desulfurivibrionaceae bacterium]|jgi:hypothetical protein